jgi:hypothetical protein
VYNHIDAAVNEVFFPAHWATSQPTGSLPGPLGHCEGDYMSDALSFTEIDRQHIELLPARTVMSMFRIAGQSGKGGAVGGDGGDDASASPSKGPIMDLLGKSPLGKLIG